MKESELFLCRTINLPYYPTCQTTLIEHLLVIKGSQSQNSGSPSRGYLLFCAGDLANTIPDFLWKLLTSNSTVPGETEVDLWPNFKLLKFSRGPRQGDPFLPTIAWFFRNNETICGSGFSHRSGFPSCDRFSRREPHHVLVYRSKPVSSTKLLSFHFHLVECQVGQVDQARQMFVWCKVRSWANILIY